MARPQISARLSFPPDALALANSMRAEDVAEVKAAGMTPLEGISVSMRASATLTTYLEDEKVIAIVGLVGLPQHVLAPWMLCTERVKDHPRVVAVESRKFMAAAATSGTCLHNKVFAESETTLDYLTHLGFYIDRDAVWYHPATQAPFYSFIADYRTKEMAECASSLSQ